MERAQEAFGAAVTAHPDSALARAHLALALNLSGNAQAEMAAAVRLSSALGASDKARVEAARAWMAYDTEGAVQACTAVLAADANDVLARFQRGILRLRQRRYEDAIADLRLVVPHAWAGPHLARAFLGAGRVDEARQAALDAVREFPDEPLPHLVDCEVRRRASEMEAALVACSRAIESDPGSVTAYQGRAYVHRQSLDFAAARKDFQAAFALAAALPDTAYKQLMLDWAKAEDISFDVAMTHLLEGDWRGGIAAAEETAAFTQRTRPANAVFYYDALGRIYLQQGKTREAARAYETGHQSIERVPGLSDDERTLWRGRWIHGLGRTHARAGRFREANAHAARLEKMIEEAGTKGEPYRPSLHYLRGYILLHERRFARALSELRQADPNDVYVEWLIARALRGAGDPAAAEEIATRLRTRSPDGFGYALVRREILAPQAP